MSRRSEIVILALVALGALAVGAGAALYFAYPTRVELAAGEARNYILSLNAPPGTVTTEQNAVMVAPAAEQQQKPNILVIMGDDIGYRNISAYNRGQMGYRTPNIDRIANEGAIFTDYYGQQSCTAGRAAFITGQSPMRTGLLKVGLPGAKEGLSDAGKLFAGRKDARLLVHADGFKIGVQPDHASCWGSMNSPTARSVPAPCVEGRSNPAWDIESWSCL